MGIVPQTTFVVSPYRNESMGTRKLGIFLLSTSSTNCLVHFVRLFFAKRERERERELLMELAVVSREEKLTEGEQSHRKEKKREIPCILRTAGTGMRPIVISSPHGTNVCRFPLLRETPTLHPGTPDERILPWTRNVLRTSSRNIDPTVRVRSFCPLTWARLYALSFLRLFRGTRNILLSRCILISLRQWR